MADSVDRVFSHALNTVNKIRTGSQKPPSATRLRLYGLYKQAMEGDVDGIMDRPEGNSEPEQRAREKWDAWKQQNGLSRTEAKRRYITTLIDTMHQYASPSPDSRELVAELEFVWDQVKSNVPSSSSSSPLQTLDQLGTGMSASYSALEQRRRTDSDNINEHENPLHINPPSTPSSADDADDFPQDEDEFVDAPDSQYALSLYRTGANDHNLTPRPRRTNAQAIPTTPTPLPRLRSIPPHPIPTPIPHASSPANNPNNKNTTHPNKTTDTTKKDDLWRKRVEASLIKLTAEIAALREQLEARRLFTHRAHYRFFRAVWRLACAAVRHVVVDLLVLVVVLGVLRRSGDTRVEGWVRGVWREAVRRLRGAPLPLPLPGLGLGLGRRREGG